MIKLIFWHFPLLFPTISSAFDLGTFVGPPSKQKNIIKLSGSLHPKTTFKNQENETKTGVQQENLNFNIPLYKGEENGMAVNGNYQRLTLSPEFPTMSHLTSIQFGGSYTHLLKNEELISFSAKYGSASDKPFKDSSVNTIESTILYSYSPNPKSSWVWLLNYSNNRPLLNNIPLPGFAYSYTPSKTFRMTFGIPFASLYWRFTEQWSVTSFVVAPWVFKTSVGFHITEQWQFFTGVDFSQMTYLKYKRVNKKERIYYDEKKIFAGFKTSLNAFLSGELEMGHSFDRSIFTAESYTRSPSNPIKIASGPYGKISLVATF